MRRGWNGPYTIAPIPWSPGSYAILPIGLVNLFQSAGSISDSGNTLSGWPTSRAEDGESAGMRHSRGRADTLTAAAVHLAGYPTCQASDAERGPDYAAANREGTGGFTLQTTAQMAGYTTPQAHDVTPRGAGSRAKSKETGDSGGACLAWDAAMTGWSTASARDWKDSEGMASHRTNEDGTPGRARDDQLPRQASLAAWPTPDAESGSGGRKMKDDLAKTRASGSKVQVTINQAAALAGWPTTDAGVFNLATEPEENEARLEDMKERLGNGNGAGKTIQQAAHLAGWATTGAADATRGSPETPEQQKARGANVGMSLIDQAALIGPARLTSDGRLLIGSCAGMESGGQLDPEHSRLLMRLPDGWESCAPTKTASILKRRLLSARQSKE